MPLFSPFWNALYCCPCPPYCEHNLYLWTCLHALNVSVCVCVFPIDESHPHCRLAGRRGKKLLRMNHQFGVFCFGLVGNTEALVIRVRWKTYIIHLDSGAVCLTTPIVHIKQNNTVINDGGSDIISLLSSSLGPRMEHKTRHPLHQFKVQ